MISSEGRWFPSISWDLYIIGTSCPCLFLFLFSWALTEVWILLLLSGKEGLHYFVWFCVIVSLTWHLAAFRGCRVTKMLYLAHDRHFFSDKSASLWAKASMPILDLFLPLKVLYTNQTSGQQMTTRRPESSPQPICVSQVLLECSRAYF